MTRIRYALNPDTNNFQSKDLIVNGQVLKVTLSPATKTFTIVNLGSGDVASQGQADTFNELKAAAKKALKGLGLTFNDEVRIRKQKVQEPV